MSLISRTRVLAAGAALLAAVGFGSQLAGAATPTSGGPGQRREIAPVVGQLAHAGNAQGTTPTIALGVFTPNAPSPTQFDTFSTLVGRRPALVMWYTSFASPLFWKSQQSMVLEEQAAPIISWDPVKANGTGVRFTAIAAGKYDAYLNREAKAVAKFPERVYVRFAHEMNLPGIFGPGSPGDTPTSFIAAWRHIVDLFRKDGATNVRWVWSPNTDCAGACPFDAYYPGNQWVSWVGLDGYNFSVVHHQPWESLRQVFNGSYQAITKLTNKPLMIAETSTTGRGGSKASWIKEGLGRQVPVDFPRVRALVWFDQKKETDWEVNSSLSSVEAFRDIVDTPLYSGKLPL